MKLSSPSGSLISLEMLLMHRDSFLPWLPSFYILLVNFKSQIQLEGRAIQRELHILEIQADASFLASNKSNCKVFHLGRNSFMNQCRMGAVGSSSTEKDLGVLVVNLSTSQQCGQQQRWPTVLTRGPGKWPFIRLHLSTVSSFGLLAVQGQYWRMGDSQPEGLQNGHELENMMHMKKLRELDNFSLEKRMLRGDFVAAYNYITAGQE